MLFPFRTTKFTRAASGASALPVNDCNAPDLYVPFMAFITYVLSMGLNKGMLKEFHPDVLVAACSNTLLAHALELVAVYCVTYFLVNDSPLGIVRAVAAAAAVGLPSNP